MKPLISILTLLLTFITTYAFDPERYQMTRALRWGLVKDRPAQKTLKPTAWRGNPVGARQVELIQISNTNNYNIYKDGIYVGWREDKKIGDNLGELRVVYSDHYTDWIYGKYTHAKVKLYKKGEELARTNPEALISRLKALEPTFDYEVRFRKYRNPRTGGTITKPYIKVIKPKQDNNGYYYYYPYY